ncbi:MAG: NAD(P)-dependent oxidoreductase [Chloroflexi bacterium]|nr:NAD(P)-dependent oxidoreductase [Chloroflexota bacterium]
MQTKAPSLGIDRKGRLQIPPQPAPRQPAEERVRNWAEVFLGFDLDTAVVEASRCLHCPAAPCVKACPLRNDIPGALELLEAGDPIAAADVFRKTSNLPEVCGRVCPQERLCEGSCVVGRSKTGKPVQIGKLEQFCADTQRAQHGLPAPAVLFGDAPVAIVGAGPAGIAAAEELTRLGHPVTVYDAWPRPGGILRFGIPRFKLDIEIVDAKVAQLEAMGVRVVPESRLGPGFGISDVFALGHAAIFLAVGASAGNRLNIPGEDLPGVYSATEFLMRVNANPADRPDGNRDPLEAGQHIVVVGAGDTAMDCVRSAVRLGARAVTCVYRRSEAEMPGRREERRYAHEEGVQFHFLASPVRALGETHVRAVEFVRMELGEPDSSGRRSVRPIAGSEFTIEVDTLVVAAGYRVDATVVKGIPHLAIRDASIVMADPETGETNLPGVFAGGDLTRGPDLVVTAVADGRRAARAIHRYLEHLAASGDEASRDLEVVAATSRP